MSHLDLLPNIWCIKNEQYEELLYAYYLITIAVEYWHLHCHYLLCILNR